MKEVIATIKLAPGRVGFYDELSRIHLTLGMPSATVYSGTNCARLRRAVRDGVIRLIDGTLGEPVPPLKIVKVNGKYKLASNAAEEMKPVFKDSAKIEEAVAPVVGVEVKDGGDIKDVQPEEIIKEEPEQAVEEAVEATEAEEKAEEKVEEPAEEPAEEVKPAKKKRNNKKKTAEKE